MLVVSNYHLTYVPFIFVLSCSCFPLGECVRGRNEQTPRNSVGCGVSLYLCPQGRRCRYQTSLFLPIQGEILTFLKGISSPCSTELCSVHQVMGGKALGSWYNLPLGCWHAFLHEGLSEMPTIRWTHHSPWEPSYLSAELGITICLCS